MITKTRHELWLENELDIAKAALRALHERAAGYIGQRDTARGELATAHELIAVLEARLERFEDTDADGQALAEWAYTVAVDGSEPRSAARRYLSGIANRAAVQSCRQVTEARAAFDAADGRMQSSRHSIPDACRVPPAGWYCTRGAGHDGPCAAVKLVIPVASAPADCNICGARPGEACIDVEDYLQRRAAAEPAQACICEPGDPCDYHAATCVVCPPGRCTGHPGP
jgi:hypothetical protein